MKYVCGWMSFFLLVSWVVAQEPASQAAPKQTGGTFFQTVKVIAPQGVFVAPATEGRFLPPAPVPQIYGFQLLKTYRFRLTGVPQYPGAELFPTVEIIDRTYPPEGRELQYPILVEISKEDMLAAIQGKYVTRVIYLENPDTAMPVAEKPEEGLSSFDVPREANPMAIAKTLGRPVAIVRIGGRVPEQGEEYDDAFLFGCPAFEHYQ